MSYISFVSCWLPRQWKTINQNVDDKKESLSKESIGRWHGQNKPAKHKQPENEPTPWQQQLWPKNMEPSNRQINSQNNSQRKPKKAKESTAIHCREAFPICCSHVFVCAVNCRDLAPVLLVALSSCELSLCRVYCCPVLLSSLCRFIEFPCGGTCPFLFCLSLFCSFGGGLPKLPYFRMLLLQRHWFELLGRCALLRSTRIPKVSPHFKTDQQLVSRKRARVGRRPVMGAMAKHTPKPGWSWNREKLVVLSVLHPSTKTTLPH